MKADSMLMSGIFVGLIVSVVGDQDHLLRKGEESEKKLRQILFTNYSRSQRPSTPVTISLNLVVSNLDKVDPKEEVIGLRIWFRMYWADKRLQWNRHRHNISSLTLDFEEIWTPDMVFYSAVGAVRDFGLTSDDGLNMSLVVYSSGLVFFSQPTTIRSACALNIADFPFDDQTCNLTFGSWTMDCTLMRLGLNKGGIDLTHFVKNNKWDLLQISPQVRMQKYFSHENELSIVVYAIRVRRKALFYVVNYVVPPVVISLLSLLLFCIPPEVGKRMEAGINLLLCLSVYLLLLNSKMPNTSTAFPLLTKFYACAIIILVLAMCCTCLVYALYFMNSSGLESHHASLFIRLKNFTLRWLQPLLFPSPCRRSKPARRARARSKVHPSQTNLNLKDADARKDKTPEECYKDDEQANSIQDPPLIITSDSRDTLPRISVEDQDEREGHLKLAKTGSSFEFSSSISSIASLKSDENVKAVMASYNEPIPAESIKSEGVTEVCKKVSFACENNGSRKGVKRRATAIHGTESPVKRTAEHTLKSSAGSSWFTQLSWDESDCEDVSGRSNEEMDQSRNLNSGSENRDSDTGDQASAMDGLDHISESFYREGTKMENADQWKKAAMVLDRMFVIVLFISIVISLVTCLLLAPRVRQYFIP